MILVMYFPFAYTVLLDRASGHPFILCKSKAWKVRTAPAGGAGTPKESFFPENSAAAAVPLRKAFRCGRVHYRRGKGNNRWQTGKTRAAAGNSRWKRSCCGEIPDRPSDYSGKAKPAAGRRRILQTPGCRCRSCEEAKTAQS